MRNGISFFKHYRRRPILSRQAARLCGAALAAALLGSCGSQPPGLPAGTVVPPTDTAALARLFVPAAAPAGDYTVEQIPEDIERVRDRVLASSGATIDVPKDAWTVQPLDPLEAFGSVARYDRTKLARLYGGHRAAVARGPVLDRVGRAIGSVTLISPYPDPTLSVLRPGTLVIVLHADRAD
ncbi:MAG TPA: hypothetical protein VGK32_21005 [Vicinamibacterales bacterium]|jgi:hypothetical protein